jgi:hypothetical protein
MAVITSRVPLSAGKTAGGRSPVCLTVKGVDREELNVMSSQLSGGLDERLGEASARAGQQRRPPSAPPRGGPRDRRISRPADDVHAEDLARVRVRDNLQ